jgi:hypothetical protein
VEISPTLCNNWKICHSSLFHTSQSWKNSPMMEMSRIFQYLLWIVYLKFISRAIFKKSWLIWRQTEGLRPFSRKFLFGILLWSQQGISFCWKKCCVFSKIWSNVFLWKLFTLWHYQDQTEKLPAAGIRLDNHRHYCAT